MALTPLEAKLKEAYKKSLEVDERRRLSDNRGDYEESFKATEEEVRVGVRAFLDHFGIDYSDESSTTELIATLREVIASHPPELTAEARPEWLIERVDELAQTLRDISYFRQGYGATSGRPQPADMRMKFAATVGSGPANAFAALLVSTRGTKPQKTEERRKRESQRRLDRGWKEPTLDFAKLHRRIVSELKKDGGSRSSWQPLSEPAARRFVGRRGINSLTCLTSRTLRSAAASSWMLWLRNLRDAS